MGWLGPGWRLPWELSLERRDGHLIHTDAQGRDIPFALLKPGERNYFESERKFLSCVLYFAFVLVAPGRIIRRERGRHLF